MVWHQFYLKWLQKTFSKPFLIADIVAFVLFIIGGFIIWKWPEWVGAMNFLLWAIPAGVFFASVLVGFFLAPYFIYKEEVGNRRRHHENIVKLAEIVREAEAMQIIEARSMGGGIAKEVFEETLTWVSKAVSTVENLLGTTAGQQLRLKAALPLNGDIKMEHLQAERKGVSYSDDSRLPIVRERYYNVRHWLEDFIENASPNPDREGSQT